jgi:segregation and condensation protein A
MPVSVKIEQFEGPLDLLLQLIENQELDITAVSLAKVTEQFLGYVKSLQDKNPLSLANFLAIAAKLLVIKSKALLPNLELDLEEEETAFDLTQQLLLYKKYKEAARFLKCLDLKRRQSWVREVELNDRITFLPDPDITVENLGLSLRSLAEELKEIVRLPQKVMAQVVSITEKIEHIQKLISDKIETSLSDLIKESKDKTEVIVTFLALLELIKQRVLVVEQEKIFSDITIKKLIT